MSYPRIRPREISSAQHVANLLDTSIVKQYFHTRKRLYADGMDPSKKDLFHPIFQRVQTFINAHINKIGSFEAVEDRLKSPLSIHDEILSSQHLFSFLKSTQKDSPRAVLHKFCDHLTQRAYDNFKKLACNSRLRGQEYYEAQNASLSKFKQTIAQIVFLADVLPSSAAESIDEKNVEQSVKNIGQLFDTEMKKILAALEKEWTAHKKMGLQDPDLVMSSRKPFAVAQTLLTSDGQINVELIKLVETYFLPKDRPLLEWEIGMKRVLGQMDFSWQTIIDEIKKPNSVDLPSNDLIRADLGLSSGEDITDQHAKQVALAALLCSLCPGPVGNGFAISWEIKNHHEFLQKSLKDYADIIEQGFLIRSIAGRRDQFFFKAITTDDDLSRTIKLDIDGKIASGAYIWECPSLHAACRQMGIDRIQYASDVLKFLFRDKDSPIIEITPEQIVEAYAEVRSTIDDKLPTDFYFAKGKYAFSQTTNRLLRACETAYASLAEVRKSDPIRRAVHACVQKALKKPWDACKEERSLKILDIVEKVKDCFDQTLDKSIRYVYNPALSSQQMSSDENGIKGGFELYMKDPYAPTKLGSRIATPEDFRKLIFHVIDAAENTLRGDSNSLEIINMYYVAANIKKRVETNQFLIDVIHHYDEANKKCADPLKQYAYLKRTPMTILDKDKPYQVEAMDTGLSFLPEVKTIPPKSPYALMKWALDLEKWKSANKMDSSNHSQPALFMRSGLSSDAWIKETLIAPGEKIAYATITDQTKKTFYLNTIHWLSELFPGKWNAGLSQRYEDFYNLFSKKILSVDAYAQSMLNCLNHLLQPSPYQAGKLSLAIDGILIHSLPKKVSAKLHSMAFRFAKSEWNDDFCVYFNSRTKELGFARMNENQTNLQPIDEYDWIENESWTIIPLG
ncbi:MAG TPA: hypothetical protein VLG49_08380 [Rhabdochlamydiaceae bacterium]|nr:hypothetical protein [Rhabdochlamydiaceae bacterium]